MENMTLRDRVREHLVAIGSIGFPGDRNQWVSLAKQLGDPGFSAESYCDGMKRIPGCLNSNGNLRGWTRLAFSSEEDQVHEYARNILLSRGFDVEVDSFGNLYGRKGEKDKPAILIGTHLDTVIDGGNYDGVVGFIVAVEGILEAERKGKLRHPVVVVVFRAEESTRFKMACLGSQAAFGFLSIQNLKSLKDGKGVCVNLAEVLEKRGYDFSSAGHDYQDNKNFLAYFETHIEQAKKLESSNAIGLVSSIRAPKRREIKVDGKRRVKAVSAMILAVESITRQFSYVGEDIVGTVGEVHGFFTGAEKINAVPGSNVIHFPDILPGRLMDKVRKIAFRRGCTSEDVDAPYGTRIETKGQSAHSGGTEMTDRQDALATNAEITLFLDDSYVEKCVAPETITFFLDLRSNCSKVLHTVNWRIDREFKEIKSDYEVGCDIGSPIGEIDPVSDLSPTLRTFVKSVADKIGFETTTIPSGAGHDAMYAHKNDIPTGMVFVKSIDGLSHTPEEYTPLDDLVRAVELQAAILVSQEFPF
jgi:acetylornithine deacetylase/succinyl-diaminopimelate desuccinylase-like protein